LYPALDTIIGEMCDVFRSSPYFHIGSDEVTSGRVSLHPGYKDFMAKHGLKNDARLADHFIARVCALVKGHGKKAIKWEGLAVTVEGSAARFEPLDAVAGKLIGRPPRPQFDAAVTTSVGAADFLDSVFAFDGNDATYFQSATPPKAGDHFTLTFPRPVSVHAV